MLNESDVIILYKLKFTVSKHFAKGISGPIKNCLGSAPGQCAILGIIKHGLTRPGICGPMRICLSKAATGQNQFRRYFLQIFFVSRLE